LDRGLIGADQFRREARAGKPPSGGVWRVSAEVPLAVPGAERTLRFCFSDDRVDRMGDTIDAAGWDLSDFERNPVALWAHDSSAPPIGAASNVAVEGNRLMGDIAFAPAETYAFADTVYRLVLGRFIRAVSVGFMPVRYRFCDSDGERAGGIDFLEQSLLEISVCPVPANPNALAEARRKGIDTRPLVEWAERTLESGGRAVVPRSELERLRKAARELVTMTKRTTRARRADDCGRAPDEACGMDDTADCSVHGGRAADPDEADEKRLTAIVERVMARRKDADPNPDVPLAHEDAIRLAHKSLRTAKAFVADAMSYHAKALDLLGGVVGALDDKAVEDDPPADDEGTSDKAAQLAKAAALRARFGLR